MNGYHRGILERWRDAAVAAATMIAFRTARGARTHREVRDLAVRRAGLLLSAGLAPEQRVVVMVHNGVEQATWLAAALLAGGCAVPIGLHQPGPRLRELVALADPAAVIVDEDTAPLAAGQRTWDGAHPGTDAVVDLPPVHDAQAAYLCFTSGTTGRPKGATVSHGVIAHTTGEIARYLDLTNRPRTHVVCTPWGFDVSMMDLWLALTTGGTLFMPERGDLLGPALIGTVADIDAPILHGVPSLFAASTDDDLARLPCGTTVMLGGESMPVRLLRGLAGRTDLHVVYGITETGVITTTHRVTDATTPEIIGSALPGVECAVVDPHGLRVPDGAPGELLIGGVAVGRGYLGDPVLTAERFIPADGGGRWYRTGDLVRRSSEGVFSFHGRMDQQLKIRGHRVEPGEVEQVLLSLPRVRQAAVVAMPNPLGELALVAYLSGDGIDRETIREQAAARMPAWMCPASIEIMPILPTSATGKVDRPALPAPVWPGTVPQPRDGDDPSADTDDASTDTEKAVGGLWRQLLGAAHVRMDDDFVALGGHSLKAAQLSTAVREQIGVTVPVPDLLAARSLREMAGVVERAVAAAPVASAAAPPALATPQQRQVWLHQQLAGPDGIYNLVVTVDLRGPLRVAALQRALHAVERRYAALRTCFVFDGQDVALEVRDPTGRQLVIRTGELAGEIHRAGSRAIDVATEVPWRYELLAQGDDHHVLLLTLHHIAIDGVALYRVLDEIATGYSAVVDPAAGGPAAPHGEDPPHGPAMPATRDPAQVGDDWAYWSTMLGDAPQAVALAGQRPVVDLTDYAGWCRPVVVACDSPARLRQAAAACGVTMQTLMLSSLLRVVARQSGQVDLVIGVPISRRGVDVDASVVGQYVNNLPIRCTLPADLDPLACADVVSVAIRQAQRHCAIDPAEIQRLLRDGSDSAGVEMFHLVFAWEDERVEPEYAGLESSWALEFNGWSDVNTVLELSGHGDAVAGRLIGRQATSAEVDADALIGALAASVGEFVAHATRGGARRRARSLSIEEETCRSR